jgi:hypothetical protein
MRSNRLILLRVRLAYISFNQLTRSITEKFLLAIRLAKGIDEPVEKFNDSLESRFPARRGYGRLGDRRFYGCFAIKYSLNFS